MPQAKGKRILKSVRKRVSQEKEGKEEKITKEERMEEKYNEVFLKCQKSENIIFFPSTA